MKPKIIILALALGASTCLLTAQESSPTPDQQNPPAQAGGPGKHGGPHLLPPHAIEALKLTADQQKQLADLEAEVRAKIQKILTPEQLEQLKQMRPPRPPGAPGGDSQREGGPGKGEAQSNSGNAKP